MYNLQTRSACLQTVLFKNLLCIRWQTFSSISRSAATQIIWRRLEREAKSAQKITDTQIEVIKDHINSFPVFQSHYSRKDNPLKKYLNPELDIRKIYVLYQDYCNEKQLLLVKVYYCQYIFNTKFDLRFYPPRKDCLLYTSRCV